MIDLHLNEQAINWLIVSLTLQNASIAVPFTHMTGCANASFLSRTKGVLV